MAMRSKRVNDPLNERVKDRIIGRARTEIMNESSGSEHSGSENSSSSSNQSLSYLLNCFDEQCEETELEDVTNNDQETYFDTEYVEEKIDEMVTTLRNLNVDRFRNILYKNVIKGVEVFGCLHPNPNTQVLNRNVMLYLQNMGYSAAICKTKWPSCGGLAAGNHEFIDVIRSDSTRYFIDLNFAGEFEIARETNQFQRFFTKLPNIFVGKNVDMKVIVRIMSDEIKRSLKMRELILPPWRKNRFMQNKWFGQYRRTVNYSSVNSSFLAPVNKTLSDVKCSMIGFSIVDNALLLHAATRTR